MKQEIEEEVFENEAVEEIEAEEEDDEQSIMEHGFKKGYEEETADPYEEKVANEDLEY